MELNKLIPNNNSKWIVKGNFLMFKKLEFIPVCYIEDDIVYVFLDARLTKQTIAITKHLMSFKVEFYFTTPEASNPKGVSEINYKVIKHYLMSYAKKEFFFGFRQINFDLIQNMVKWTDKENCFDLVKNIYLEVLKKVNNETWDYYSNRKFYDYQSEIREEFQSLYRHIQISKII